MTDTDDGYCLNVNGHLENVSKELADKWQALERSCHRYREEAAFARKLARTLLLILTFGLSALLIHRNTFLALHSNIRLYLIDGPLVILVPIAIFYRKKEWHRFAAWWDSEGLPILALSSFGYWIATDLFAHI
jgi:hypothetical protein